MPANLRRQVLEHILVGGEVVIKGPAREPRRLTYMLDGELTYRPLVQQRERGGQYLSAGASTPRLTRTGTEIHGRGISHWSLICTFHFAPWSIPQITRNLQPPRPALDNQKSALSLIP